MKQVLCHFWSANRFNNSRNILSKVLQGVREISAIIVTDDYLCYKEPKSLILIFTEWFKFKTSDERQHWKMVSLLSEYKYINLLFT